MRVLVVVVLLCACDGPSVADAGAPDAGLDGGADAGRRDAGAPGPRCTEFDEGTEVARVQAAALTEISGIALSRRQPVIWAHNDSGDGPSVYAIGRDDGAELGRWTMRGTVALDMEDMAIGPGPDGADHLYLADIGNNFARTGGGPTRGEVTVHRVREPDVGSEPGDRFFGSVETLRLRYADEPYDAEAFVVDPLSGDLFVVSKTDDGASAIYRVAASALSPDSVATLEPVADLTLGPAGLGTSPRATAADLSPSGHALLLRTESQVFLFERAVGADLADVFERAIEVSARPEPQGEAIGWASDERAFYTISEGLNPPIWRFVATRCE